MLKKNDSRLYLTAVWMFFFVVNIFIILRLRYDNWLQDENDFMKALSVINNVYSPYLGVILLFFWTRRKYKASSFNFNFFLALAMSLLWNIFIVIILGEMLWGKGEFNNNLELIKNIGGIFSWLVAGAIGFYFGTDNPVTK